MINYLKQTENPILNHVVYFEVLRDFRIGGLNPEKWDEFLALIKKLPIINERREEHYKIFNHLNLKDITMEQSPVIMREITLRSIEKSKKCWHPEASATSCNIDASGKIKVTAAHSIQNNGILSKIVENGHVMSYAFEKGEFDGKQLGKNYASIFWGFCNKHDAIFAPIETQPYQQTKDQNFLFAYRGFVVASHKKIETSNLINYGEQANSDIIENKKIFDAAIIAQTYNVIETEIFELPAFYPIAVSSAFYLDFDFDGTPIKHSEARMENIFITMFPSDNKTYFLLSYFQHDKHLYGNLSAQLRKRNNLKSDITMLIAAHAENVYFNPVYYKTFIEKYEEDLSKILVETQFDWGSIDDNNEAQPIFSLTPNNYLKNQYGTNFFGY